MFDFADEGDSEGIAIGGQQSPLSTIKWTSCSKSQSMMGFDIDID
jgi:hypothetical protein